MGYDIVRFVGEIDANLICVICANVFEDPIVFEECEHAFCKACITTWFTQHTTCPIDRSEIKHIRPAPRILRNFLSQLQIKCDYATFGCEEVVNLDNLSSHKSTCDSNPEMIIPCANECGAKGKRSEMSGHSCVSYLRAVNEKANQRMKVKLDVLKREFDRKMNKMKREMRDGMKRLEERKASRMSVKHRGKREH